MTVAGLATGGALALVLLIRALVSTLLEPAGQRALLVVDITATLLAVAFAGLTVAQLAEFLR
ncbi:MAG: hypothetical protein JWO02_2707 [Solirubrobacterales bacterium]|nr:hypothetical protein [Solirubrobacterales bacterium]